jgi:hypothetical protein
MQKVLEQIAATAELMGREISPAAAAVMVRDLDAYPQEVVIQALANLRREKNARFSTGAVIEQIEKLRPDGRPGADEAWAMIPRDEAASVVWTQEMAEAYGIALPLLSEGDQVAARMAFREAYARIVEANKQAGVKPVWQPSLGHDKEGRDAALAEAVRLGRLSTHHAIGLLPPGKIAPMLQAAGQEKLAIEYKPDNDSARKFLDAAKLLLEKKQERNNGRLYPR